MDLRRAMLKARHLPAYRGRNWAAIPPDLLHEMVCESVQVASEFERTYGARLRASRREMIESGEWADHPQLGLVPRAFMDELIAWASEE